jgi:two-component system, OmpR family, sensor histidine kinase MtrB
MAMTGGSRVNPTRDERLHTESQDIERLQARVVAAERVGELLAHELRNVVIVLRTHSDLLAHEWDKLEEGDRRRSIETMDHETEYLGELVSSLLDMARSRRRTFPEIDVRAHIGDRVHAELEAGSFRGVEVRVDVPRGLRITVDVDLLDLTIRNLLRNAIHHGAPPVVFSAWRTPTVFGLRVEDHGPGVAPAFVPRLFDRFQRSDPSGPGLGLGLAIVRELVELNHGTVQYQPGTDRGAAFVLELPVRDEHPHRTPPVATDAAPTGEDSADEVRAGEGRAGEGIRRNGSPRH